jgi:hypothetical protein
MANYGYGPPSWKINYDERTNPKRGDGTGYGANPGVMDKNIFGMAKPGGNVSIPSALLTELLAPSMVDTSLTYGGEIKPTMNNPQDMGMWSRMLYNAASDPVGTAANSLLNTVIGGFTQIPSTLLGAGRSAYEALTSKQDGSKVPVESLPVGMNLQMNTKIQDPAQAKGLAGRRLSPYKKVKIPTSKKINYGSEGKTKKAESAYSVKQRKKKEEEEKAFQKMMMNYNQRSQNAIPRLGIVPKTVWDTWVPDSSTSNYATFDDAGRFDGLDMETMIFDLDTIGLLDKPMSPDAMSSALKSMMKPE